MNYTEALTIASVPADRHAEAISSVEAAKLACKGLLWHKIKARYWYAGKIADALEWGDERLCTVRPDWADWDIAPVINVTAHGDNGPWHHTPHGDQPDDRYWLNADPASDEYKAAVAANYWLPGTHPRSKESRKAWYRRNAGEFKAWRLGAEIDPAKGFEIWRGESGKTRVIVWQCSGAWLVKTSTRLIGSLCINARHGYELDNVFSGDYTPQMWWPLPGYELRACVTSSVVPGGQMGMERKQWESGEGA